MSHLMWFKIGISTCSKVEGKWVWTHSYSIRRLPEDSTLSEVAEDNPDFMACFGLREDQPEYEGVHDFQSLQAAFDNRLALEPTGEALFQGCE